MNSDQSNVLAFYASPGPMTSIEGHEALLESLPEDLPSLVQVVQNNLVHAFWAERYGLSLTEEQKVTLNVRRAGDKLRRIAAEDARPLAAGRELGRRQVGNCRDFSLLLVSLLRSQGRPARARCGFGAYFEPGHYEDHWVAEVWDSTQGHWVLVDAQLDAFQRDILKLSFDPLDVPRDQFITGGRAWEMMLHGEADPRCFGIFDMNGPWFIWGNVIRDLLSLNKVEILPWDWWESPYWSHRLEDPLPPEEELEEFNRLAALTLAGDEGFAALREEYENNLALHPPQTWLQGDS